MSRVAQKFSKAKILTTIAPAIVIVVGIVGAITSQNATPKTPANHPTQNATYSYNCDPAYNFIYYPDSSGQTTDVTYKGAAGQKALNILTSCAQVQTKHYSFGDQVVSINGTDGNGPKYWTFYINGKMAEVGAGSYATKSTDQLEWKLQAL